MITASLDVDVQNTFTPRCPDELPIEGGDRIVYELNRQAKKATLRAVSKDTHAPHAVWITTNPEEITAPLDYPNADKKWNSHAMIGTYGWQLIEGLPRVEDYDIVVYKGLEPSLHPYGACYHTYDRKVSTGLLEYFVANGVERVIVGGLAMEFCVMQTLREMADYGKFEVILNLAATRALTPNGFDETIKEIAERRKQGQNIRVINNIDELEIKSDKE
jgi:nicotinamidase/pyrazinamidase